MERIFQYEDYVCPRCFEHANNCSCDGYLPDHLIIVDPSIQEHVRILNHKGYHTQFCCESHDPRGNLYIMFQRAHGFGKELPSPEGFKCKHGGKTVEHTYGKDSRARKKITTEEFEHEKTECLTALLKWCDELPVNAKAHEHSRILPRYGQGCPLNPKASIKELFDSYMCIRCGKSAENCTCEFFPPSSVHLLDNEIRHHVDILGEKGYELELACAGHGPNSSVRIMFYMPPKPEALNELPFGFACGKECGWTFVEHRIDADLSNEDAEADRKAALSNLLKWCEELEDFSYDR